MFWLDLLKFSARSVELSFLLRVDDALCHFQQTRFLHPFNPLAFFQSSVEPDTFRLHQRERLLQLLLPGLGFGELLRCCFCTFGQGGDGRERCLAQRRQRVSIHGRLGNLHLQQPNVVAALRGLRSVQAGDCSAVTERNRSAQAASVSFEASMGKLGNLKRGELRAQQRPSGAQLHPSTILAVCERVHQDWQRYRQRRRWLQRCLAHG